MLSSSACSDAEIENAVRNTESVSSVIFMTERETHQYLDMILQNNINIQEILKLLNGMETVTGTNATQINTLVTNGLREKNQEGI